MADDKTVAVVTGASRGAGLGIAHALGSHGCTVYVTGRTEKPGQSPLGGTIHETAELVTAAGGEGIAVPVDHADDEQTKALFDRVAREQGRVDILVNNAAIIRDEMMARTPFWEKPTNVIDILDVGLRSGYVATVYAAPLMTPQRHGLVVFTSAPGAAHYVFGPSYGVHKAGVDKMAADMAVDFKEFGIASVSVWMGILLTERLKNIVAGAPEKFGSMLDIAETPELTGHLDLGAVQRPGSDGEERSDVDRRRTGRRIRHHRRRESPAPVVSRPSRYPPAPAVSAGLKVTSQAVDKEKEMNPEQLEKAHSGAGFIAALDQSGGSTPKALKLYGIEEDAYSGDEQMFDLVHEMRTRIITSPAFEAGRIMGAILFEMTMDRQIEGRPSADYLWNVKGIVPFLKIDKGLAEEQDGAQTMKPMPGLDDLLDRAVANGVFGTKERSVIKLPGAGLDAVVAQQFEVGKQVLAKGLVPIIEPEVDIHSAKKAEAEDQLKAGLLDGLNQLGDGQKVMLKLTLPDTDNLYRELVEHPNVVRVVALSGGYSRDEACEKLARNNGVIASFSRALTEGLTAQQSDEEFNATLDAAITEIAKASAT